MINLQVYRRHFGSVADLLGAVGLAMPAFRLYEWLESRRPSAVLDDAPPAYYRVLTVGITDPFVFAEIGEKAANQIIDLATRAALTLGPETQVLDFGSGCGRVAKPLVRLTGVALNGCDIHKGMVRWCQANLKGKFTATRPSPPLPYATGQFDLVYALSVFTHVSEEVADAWLAELARVTRSGGVAIFSFLDEQDPAAQPFKDELERDGFHMKRRGTEGSNLMVGFFTHKAFAKRASRDWEMAFSVPTPQSVSSQAIMVLKRR